MFSERFGLIASPAHRAARRGEIGVREIRNERILVRGNCEHAQSKPPVCYVAELKVLNPDALKEWGAKVEASIKATGGPYSVRGANITGLDALRPSR